MEIKKKTKIVVAATAIAITSLKITAYHTQPPTSLVSSQIAPVSEVVAPEMATTPHTATEPIASEKIAETGTQIEEIIEPTPIQTPQPQPIEKEETTNTPTLPTQITLHFIRLFPVWHKCFFQSFLSGKAFFFLSH